jgi:hypothetical protein
MTPDSRVLEGTTALRALAKYGRLSTEERVYELADLVNWVEHYPGAQPGNEKWDQFPTVEALRRWPEIMEHVRVEGYTHVVTLGAAVRDVLDTLRVFGPGRREWFKWYRPRVTDLEGVLWACSPHTGGTSFFWNDLRRRATGEAFWSGVFRILESDRRSVDGLVLREGEGRKVAEY